MKKLIAVTVLALVALLIFSTTTLAGKGYDPSYGLSFVAQNNMAETVSVKIECLKGNFLANVSPGQTFGYGVSYDQPPGGFPPDWFGYEGDLVVHVNNQIFVKHVKCLANLSKITVIVNPERRGTGLKVEIQLTQ